MGNDIIEAQNYKVVKSNELIQKSRFSLSVHEQKIILYLISKIKPEDIDLKTHTFEIVDFCRICGLDKESGGNYKYIKDTIKSLSDKSVWIKTGDEEILLRWIYTAKINRKSGMIAIMISDDVKPYVLQLQEKFTQYELFYTLAMKSQYSVRLYELMKSYEYRHAYVFTIEELKTRLNAEKYQRFPDFRRYVLEIALREVNEFSDLSVKFTLEKEGRRYAKIKFSIKLKKDYGERLKAWKQIEANLGGKNKK